jgi:hypothetical protein
MVTYTEETMISNIFTGLPSIYDSVREYWDWMKVMIDPKQAPSTAVLFKRLMMKESELKKARTPCNSKYGVANGDTDKQGLKCTFD